MMSNNGFAYFVNNPRTSKDLLVPHLIEREQKYEIVKTITLPKIDYENFTTDMRADRWFLEENDHLCSRVPTIRCMLIKQRGKDGGILVVPNGAWVNTAAFNGE